MGIFIYWEKCWNEPNFEKNLYFYSATMEVFIVHSLILLVMFFYYMKTVRIWLESTTPLTLQQELKKFKYRFIFLASFPFLMMIPYIVFKIYFYQSDEYNSRFDSIVELSWTLIMAVFGVTFFLFFLDLIYFFVKKRFTVLSRKSEFKVTFSEKLGLVWILLIMIAFTMFVIIRIYQVTYRVINY
jgi:hypothetical protein